MTHPQTIFGSISFAVSVLLTVVNSSSMNDAQSETATGSDGESNSVDAAAGSTGDQAATTNHNWRSMEVQFRARAEAEGHDGIVRFGSEADLMEFLTAHLQTCSTAILEKYLTSQDRTAAGILCTYPHITSLPSTLKTSANHGQVASEKEYVPEVHA